MKERDLRTNEKIYRVCGALRYLLSHVDEVERVLKKDNVVSCASLREALDEVLRYFSLKAAALQGPADVLEKARAVMWVEKQLDSVHDDFEGSDLQEACAALITIWQMLFEELRRYPEIGGWDGPQAR